MPKPHRPESNSVPVGVPVLHVPRENEITEPESDDMRLRDHKGITEGRIDILFCKPGDLQIEDGYNVRDLTTPQARAELDELKAEVKEHGIQTPLKVRFDGENIIIVEGHRRRVVVMELLAEFKESKGEHGRKIEAVPIYAEAKGTTPLDRDFGLRHSNSGVPLKPLEFANLIYRTINQRGISEKDAAKGFAISVTVLRNHLSMREMPEAVKEQVRQGDVSPTLANKLVKEARAAKDDPEQVAEFLRKNKEENARIKGKKRSTKVTLKTIKRDKEKAKPQEPNITADAMRDAPPPQQESPPTPIPQHVGALGTLVDDPNSASGQRLAPVASQSHKLNGAKELIEALEPFAALAKDNDLNAKADDDLLEVFVRDVKRAWTVYSAATGGES